MEGNRPFGEFLRSRRARLTPGAGGEAPRRRRRTPGLKREEIAERAGISAEWYVKLEQGRAVSPSPETVDALGRALLLDEVELRHLRMLAVGGEKEVFRREVVPDTLQRLVAALPEPAYVTGRRLDILAWNDAATRVFGDFGRLAVDDRNILLWMLTDPCARSLFGTSWSVEARRMTSLFRAAYDLSATDDAFAALVGRLRDACPDFGIWWSTHDVGMPVSGTKDLHHPTSGPMRFDYASFQANDDPALKLALYTRRASAAARVP